MKRSELFFTVALVPIDALAIILAFITAYFWRSAGQTELFLWPFDDYLRLTLMFLPGWLLIFASQGLYRMHASRLNKTELPALVIGTLASWSLFVIGLYFMRSPQTSVLPRLLLIYIFALSFVYVSVARWGTHLLQRFLYKYGIGIRRILFIAEDTPIARTLGHAIQSNRSLGYRIVGTVAPAQISNLATHYTNSPFDEIVLAEPNLPEEEIFSLIHFCEDRNLGFRQIPNVFEVKSSNLQISTLNGIPIIEFRHTPLEGWGRVAKRAIDIIGSTLGITVLSPLLAVIALLIKIDSRGSLLYRHEAIGMGGAPLKMLKFRTMKQEYCMAADDFFSKLAKDPELKKEFEVNYKLKEDPRVTRIGHLLRKTSLDELPQLFNVLRGDMSLVGPRPIVEKELDRYGISKYKRHIIRPGITGLWQVSGRSDIQYEERVKLDLYYLEKWSIWLDLSILFKTFARIGKNAY